MLTSGTTSKAGQGKEVMEEEKEHDDDKGS
jgi:hypothetical protein